jgi:uncharacterized protein
MPDLIDSAISATPILRLEANGNAYLIGSKCQTCKAVMPGERLICPSCGARHDVQPIRLGNQGTIQSHTVVYRSYPGAVTPFVSAIVQLKGGAIVKGTLVDVDPDPARIPSNMEVDVVYRDTGQRNSQGLRFISYYFVPRRANPNA